MREDEDEAMPTFLDVQNISPDQADNEKQLETVISDALKDLSIGERERVYHEIHGVADEIEETPEFIAEKLDELDRALETAKHNRGLPTGAYHLAEAMSMEYVEDVKFRKSFLRTDDFDAQLAAERMIRFFDFKQSLFGSDRLCKTITYADLGSDIRYLEKGGIQVLPVRDRAGRPVMVMFPSQQDYSTVGSSWTNIVGRMYFYMRTLMEDDALEKKGVVWIAYNVGEIKFQELDPMIPVLFYKSLQAMPIKVAAAHLCFSNFLFRPIAYNFLKMLGSNKSRAAGKLHQGSQQEVLYSLMTYGIPTEVFPVNFTNEVKRTNHMDMIVMARKRAEYQKGDLNNAVEYVIIPGILDVLFGKGTMFHNRPGNMRLKILIDELLPHQSSLTTKNQKVALVQQVVDTVKTGGSRFLSKERGVWVEVHDDAARSKVANLFRNRRKVAQQQNRPLQVLSKPQTAPSGHQLQHHRHHFFHNQHEQQHHAATSSTASKRSPFSSLVDGTKNGCLFSFGDGGLPFGSNKRAKSF